MELIENAIAEIILSHFTVYMNQENCSSVVRFAINLKNSSTSRYYLVRFSSQNALERLYIGEIIFGN